MLEAVRNFGEVVPVRNGHGARHTSVSSVPSSSDNTPTQQTHMSTPAKTPLQSNVPVLCASSPTLPDSTGRSPDLPTAGSQSQEVLAPTEDASTVGNMLEQSSKSNPTQESNKGIYAFQYTDYFIHHINC